MAGTAGTVAARRARLRVPLLFLSVVGVCLSDRRNGQLRRAAAGGVGGAIFADRAATVRGGHHRLADLRLGLPVWLCSGFAGQDLVPWKLTLPGWMGYTRYAVLVGLVIALPMVLGYQGVPFDKQTISICRLCPAGALEAGLPYSIHSVMAGTGWLMSGLKTGILIAFFAAALLIHRPWCRIFCPLGGLLALFNRLSLFHLRFNPKECVECNLCRSRCSMGVKVDQNVNVSGCIRCLECTTCGAIEPAVARPTASAEEPKAS